MEKMSITSKEAHDFFVQSFKENTLVPVIGSGFSSGYKTKRGGIVPNGTEFKAEMISRLVNAGKGDRDELLKEQFSSVAEVFQNVFSDPEKEGIIDYFLKNYTGVNINRPYQLNFLKNIDWPYLYTLNIDTGIEDSCEDVWEVFYPNKRFDERIVKEGRKKLFKIHGDVAMFCKTLMYDEMILTESQYIESLARNEKFHDLLTADCGSKNLMYIGCSLDDEIDIKYSVLSDKNRNIKNRDIRGLYVTTEELKGFKESRLEGYNISHIIQLENLGDYEHFYEFIYDCYKESLKENISNISQFKFIEREKLDRDKAKNLEFLSDLGPKQGKLPYYYVPSSYSKKLDLVYDKINVIVGRRYTGKSMMAYSILENAPNLQRYFVSTNETLAEKDIYELMKEENSIVIFDSESLDDKSFNYLLNVFNPKTRNIVCVFLNSFDDITNLISFKKDILNEAISKEKMRGKLPKDDVDAINEKLNSLGIAVFNQQDNILDNTLRLANVYEQNVIEKYKITSIEELEIIIWLLVKSKIYYEDVVSLGLAKQINEIVSKYSPLIQKEKCKRGELCKHSSLKIICNGKLGLLQLVSGYIYTSTETDAAKGAMMAHQDKVCDAIFRILQSYKMIDMDYVKDFLLFDRLNDIFSREYSEASVTYIKSKGAKGRRNYGAASIIHKVYENSKIQQIKADDPNYWLQRAKSIYIMNNYAHKGSQLELYKAIDWAKKAEQDSKIKISNGETKYLRTESNAIMQIAMLQGKISRLRKYEDVKANENAIEYYYKGFSDSNNIAASKTLLNNSRGTQDFKQFVTELVSGNARVGEEWSNEKNFLINIGIGHI